jgi:glycosyltransferase involved in cell wall biosynthesis
VTARGATATARDTRQPAYPDAGIAAHVGDRGYALVHLVAHESFEELIEAQVVEPMIQQARLDGPLRPTRVIIGFLEPARVALSARHRRRMRALRRRSASVATAVLPFVSRLGIPANAWILALRLQRLCAGLPIVLHCRGESAAMWGAAIARNVPDVAVISDVRGIWPGEFLLRRGYRTLDEADAQTRQDYSVAIARMRASLAGADAVFAVSNALAEWLSRVGVHPERVLRVPCCVAEISYAEATREGQRTALGLGNRTVLAYLGGVAPYQHLEDGLVPFAKLALALDERAHLLCITNDPMRMQALLDEGGVTPRSRTTVVRVAQPDVPRVLAAADAGFLLREPTEVNRVAMPVKVGEYVASGVPLVVSRISGELDDLVRTYDAGIVVPWFELGEAERVQEVRRVLSELRDRPDALRAGALALCEARFLWATHVPAIRRAYVQALRSGRASPRA